MTTMNEEENARAYSGFFHRSLSPRSFERLRTEHSDYFYQPKRGPSTSKSNITITRPIRRFETMTKLVELLNNNNNPIKHDQQQQSTTKQTQEQTTTTTTEEVESPPLSKKFDDQRSSSRYSSFLSMDGGDLSSSRSTSSSLFSSRSNSSISTVAEHEPQVVFVDEPSQSTTQQPTSSSTTNEELVYQLKKNDSLSPCRIPALGLNVTQTGIHIVLLELYPQNVDYSVILFQRYLLGLIIDYEHKNWSISNVELQVSIEQEANLRLFTLTHEQFDILLVQLQSFTRYNPSIASSFVLNIALTGNQTNEYEAKISARMNKINLNFDIIQSPAESYMIGLDFSLGNSTHNEDELIEIVGNHRKTLQDKTKLYPYILVHAEVASTFFYIVHSPSKYSVLTSNNLCYKTYYNLIKLAQPGYDPINNDEPMPPSTYRPPTSSYLSSPLFLRHSPPVSFDFTRQDLCKKCHRSSSSTLSSQVPLTSLTRLPQRYLPANYSSSNTPHYIYRGWTNRRTASYDTNLATFDVHTQTDDSFLELSSSQTRQVMRRSLLSMFTMNMALTLKLLLKFHPTIQYCMLSGEFFQLEKEAAQDLEICLRSILGQQILRVCQLKREPLIAALGCALPRVYFDVIDEQDIPGIDCIS